MDKSRLPEPERWDGSMFYAGMDAIRHAHLSGYRNIADYFDQQHARARQAWSQMKETHELHPVVRTLVTSWRPLDWHQLLLEWPHVSVTDANKLAFTRSERDWLEDRQTVTSIGKYVQRHWANLPDHVLRDAVATYSLDEFKIGRTTPEIIMGIELGARSCMQSGYGSIPFTPYDASRMRDWLMNKSLPEPRWDKHPYSVYDPSLGWGMATRTKNGEVLGRALVLDTDQHGKVFVRSYVRRSNQIESSGSDQILEQWLNHQGYTKLSSWPDGARILRLEHPTSNNYRYFTPYIDGWHHCVSDDCDAKYLVIDEKGNISCDHTDGGQICDNAPESVGSCTCCGQAVYEDSDYIMAGPYEDNHVCEHCQDDYVHVWGQRGGYDVQYYVHQDNAEQLRNRFRHIDVDSPPSWAHQAHDDAWYHEDDVVYVEMDDMYVSQEDAIQLYNNEWAYRDNAVQMHDERYAHENDSDLVELHDGQYALVNDTVELENGQRALTDDAWECTGTAEWYLTDDISPISISGDNYHPHYLLDQVPNVEIQRYLNEHAAQATELARTVLIPELT